MLNSKLKTKNSKLIWLIGNKGMLGREVESLLQNKELTYVASDQSTNNSKLITQNLRPSIKQRTNRTWPSKSTPPAPAILRRLPKIKAQN